MFASTLAPARNASRPLAVIAVVLLAVNLRASISSAAALLDSLALQQGLTALTASLITTIPLLAFAVGGALTVRVVARFGVERTVVGALVALTIGLAARGVPQSWALLTGTTIGMLGLAMCNVALPAFIRAAFPARIGLLTSVYTTAMAAGATIAAASAVPIAVIVASPNAALASWALPAALAAAAWLPLAVRSGRAPKPGAQHAAVTLADVARTRFGRLITAYFAVQALNCYVMIGWLPSILVSAGFDQAFAGLLLAVMQGVGIPMTFLILGFTSSATRTRIAFTAVSACTLAGFAGLLLAPAPGALVWSLLIGIGLCSFPLILASISRSSASAAEVTAVSALAQSVGYAMAAAGSLGFGLLHAATGGWTMPLLALIGLAVIQLTLGLAFTKPSTRRQQGAPSGSRDQRSS
ncbi:MFS transporter [Plantibacter sp. Mn2098]|uniref:MFS transporter n=1 Tax=Plantibacter sp. Mn2098 TaxID=3395266 RepID=UPI003BC305D4